MSKLSEQLQELMDEDGLTQSDLAKKLNTNRSKISSYINDNALPTFKVFVMLVGFFNCSADFLAGLKDYPERDKKYSAVQPFCTRIKIVLKKLGVSQYRLQKQTGISWSVLHSWFTGKTNPTADSLKKIAQTLQCSIDFLLGRTD